MVRTDLLILIKVVRRLTDIDKGGTHKLIHIDKGGVHRLIDVDKGGEHRLNRDFAFFVFERT